MIVKRLSENFNNLLMASVVAGSLAAPGVAIAQVNDEQLANEVNQALEQSVLEQTGSPVDFENLILLLGIPLSILLLNRVLRSVAMRPKEQDFGAIHILKNVTSKETVSNEMRLLEKAPWFLAATFALTAAAGPDFNKVLSMSHNGPVLISVDNSYAAAPDWEKRRNVMREITRQAYNDNREIVFLKTARGANGESITPSEPMSGPVALSYIETMNPVPWNSNFETALEAINDLDFSIGATYWLSDGLDHKGQSEFYRALNTVAPLEVYADQDTANLMMPPVLRNGEYQITIKRADIESPENLSVVAYNQEYTQIGSYDVQFKEGQSELNFAFPREAYTHSSQTVQKFSIDMELGAGATAIVSENHRPKTVGIATLEQNGDIGSFLDERFFLSKALSGYTETRRGQIESLIDSQGISVLLIPDAVPLGDLKPKIENWVRNGGTLVRFAGPNLVSEARIDDALLPVNLESGSVALSDSVTSSGASSDVGIEDAPASSPLFGLDLDGRISFSRQLFVESSDDLKAKTWASFSDGTPLLSANEEGLGRVFLVHTTANTVWSDFVLSDGFVDVLQAIVRNSNSIENNKDYKIPALAPLSVLNGAGQLNDPSDYVEPLTHEVLSNKVVGPENPPGLYGTQLMQVPYNLSDSITDFSAMKPLPESISQENYTVFEDNKDIKDYLWTGALALFLLGTFVLTRRRKGSYQNDNNKKPEPALGAEI